MDEGHSSLIGNLAVHSQSVRGIKEWTYIMCLACSICTVNVIPFLSSPIKSASIEHRKYKTGLFRALQISLIAE